MPLILFILITLSDLRLVRAAELPDIPNDSQISPEKKTHAQKVWEGDIHLGLNMLSFFSAAGGKSDNRVAFLGGARAKLNFQSQLGAVFGFDYTTRGAYSLLGVPYEAQFVDIYLEGNFKFQELFFSKSVSEIAIGPILFWPLSDLKGGNQLIQARKLSYGIQIQFLNEFDWGWPIRPGVLLWSRASLTNAFEPGTLGRLEKIIEAGIGLSAGF